MDKDESEREGKSEEYQRFEDLARKLLTAPQEQVERVKRESRKQNKPVSQPKIQPGA